MNLPISKKIFSIILLLMLQIPVFAAEAPWVGSDVNEMTCFGNPQAYGPFDYRKRVSLKYEINVVESHHFTKEIENLKPKSGRISIVDDVDYTLRAFPNHHRALLSIVRYQLKINRGWKYKKLLSPVECYLQRAINFQPEDIQLYSIFGYYLKKIKQYNKSEEIYKKALLISPESPRLLYSYSLLLIEIEKYDDALKYAKMAYKKGNPPQELKNKLIKLNKWVD